MSVPSCFWMITKKVFSVKFLADVIGYGKERTLFTHILLILLIVTFLMWWLEYFGNYFISLCELQLPSLKSESAIHAWFIVFLLSFFFFNNSHDEKTEVKKLIRIWKTGLIGDMPCQSYCCDYPAMMHERIVPMGRMPPPPIKITSPCEKNPWCTPVVLKVKTVFSFKIYFNYKCVKKLTLFGDSSHGINLRVKYIYMYFGFKPQ